MFKIKATVTDKMSDSLHSIKSLFSTKRELYRTARLADPNQALNTTNIYDTYLKAKVDNFTRIGDVYFEIKFETKGYLENKIKYLNWGDILSQTGGFANSLKFIFSLFGSTSTLLGMRYIAHVQQDHERDHPESKTMTAAEKNEGVK